MQPKARGSDELCPVAMGLVVDLVNSLTTRNFCAALLQHLNHWLRVDHCAVMRMSAGPAIQVFGTQALQSFESRGARAIVRYIDRYHRLDPIRGLFDVSDAQPAIVMRRERAAELAPSEYRRACYDDPSIVDRVTLARQDGRGAWVMLDTQRQAASGEFSEQDCDVLARVAPLLATLCARHIELLEHAGADPAAWRLRLASACPAMTGRELDVAAQLLAGSTLRESAEALGVAYSSVVTYCERAYSRLGVANLRELRGRFAGLRSAAASAALATRRHINAAVRKGDLYPFAA